MAICVTLVENNGRVTSQVFDKEKVTIGRSAVNDVRPDPILHSQVSRVHGSVALQPDGTYCYEDLGSTQGSYFEGRELRAPLKLKRGDSVVLGKDGPRLCFTWGTPRVTGRDGTHYKAQRPTPAFPLAFSEAFFDRFRRYEKIAAGGFGEVWSTVSEEDGRRLAIKLMHPSLLAPDALNDEDRASLVARFSREARLTFLLSRSGAPSIVKVHDYGDDPARDFIYIIMDHVVGYSFDRIITPKEPLSLARVARYMSDVARGLDAAHNFVWTLEDGVKRRGVLHRDIKPNNLLIEEATDKCWIVDFGVAGIQEGGDRLTATNITVGTHHFLPPESIADGTYDVGTDLWGFTMTLFVALSGGRFPFPLDIKADSIRAQYEATYTSLRRFRPDLPEELVQAIDRSLEAAPSRRIQSAADWVRQLSPYC
jgi:serine/threonine protein kinase